MQLKRQSLNVRHSVKFQRMAPGLVTQSGQLLEALMDRLAAQYSLSPQDIAVRSGATLEDWSLRIALFNRLGTITIGVSPAVGHRVLDDLARASRAEMPSASIALRVLRPAEIASSLREHRVDFVHASSIAHATDK